MASDTRTVDPENVAGLMNPIMLKYQLNAQDVKKERGSVQDVHGFGEYYCDKCKNAWRSYFSWISVDLKDQRIVKRWTMKCKICLCMYKPKFMVPETEKLFEKAVCQYKGIPYRPEKPDGMYQRRREFTHPHFPPLCEKCLWGQTQCWIRQ